MQVKSSWTKRQNVYQFKTSGSGRPYRRGEVDFIVVLVVPEEAWYVIPAEVVRGRDCATVSPHIRGSRARLEKYREAWQLLRAGVAAGPDLMPRAALLDCDLE